MSIWLTADKALDLLGTKPQSLYASVSRGRVRAKTDPEDSRRSLYLAEDVERLASRSGGRRRAEVVAAEAIRWGDPVLPSALSTAINGHLYYRGRDAIVLSRSADLEEVAELLWGGRPRGSGSRVEHASADGFVGMMSSLARQAGAAMPSHGRAQNVLLEEAAQVFAAMLDCAAGADGKGAAHERLARHWERPQAADVLRRAMVLFADHELNASTFTARVTVSAGASLVAGTLAALCTLSGPLHGDATSSVLALAARAEAIGPREAIAECLAQGRPVPSFGHRLYPDGDPRARELLSQLEVPRVFAELLDAGRAITGEEPNVDFALAALCTSYDLPKGAALTLFAVSRSVGWLAHMIEQAISGTLIRPRARYIGEPVSAVETSQSMTA